jgi:hypothetical protein
MFILILDTLENTIEYYAYIDFGYNHLFCILLIFYESQIFSDIQQILSLFTHFLTALYNDILLWILMILVSFREGSLYIIIITAFCSHGWNNSNDLYGEFPKGAFRIKCAPNVYWSRYYGNNTLNNFINGLIVHIFIDICNILILDTLKNTIEYYVYIDFRYIREYNRVLCLYWL